MAVTVFEVKEKSGLKKFIDLQWEIYRNNPAWVPPLRREMKRIISPQTNSFLQSGPFRLFLAVKDGRVAGRVMAHIDQKTNAVKGRKAGYISLFESIPDYRVAAALFDSATAFHREHGMTSLLGPVSPTNGDDYRGLLLNDFNRPPVLMNSYNPPYYPEFFDRYGFRKQLDLYAYHFDVHVPRTPKVVEYARRRYGYTIDPINLANLEKELLDIKRVLDEAMPEEWANLIPPDLATLEKMAKNLRPLVDPNLVFIARHKGRPIGFNLTLPDYNQVLIRLRSGRLFPVGWLKFLYWKRKIDGLRFFVLFVVPEFRKKGVSAAIFLETFNAVQKHGYRWLEGSTIGEINREMRNDVERAGGKHYRTYRIYEKKL
ncbi:MAG: GNAT family N-acetyltransferase [Firmicutes bacterium]|nr:GNAT family N-acetyltransferase [Bacillota bacterium]